MAEMEARFGAARVARLATAGPDGPHVVPITFALAEGRLYSAIDHKPKSGRPLRRLSNIRADARVAVLVDHYSEAWTELWWVRIDGLAQVAESEAELAAGRQALLAKYPQYQGAPAFTALIVVTPVRWSAWTGSPAR